jgi:hypothetical protein
LLPVFLYVALKAKVRHLASIWNYIEDFVDHSEMDSGGEYGFSMINSGMEWALEFEVPQEVNSPDVRTS